MGFDSVPRPSQTGLTRRLLSASLIISAVGLSVLAGLSWVDLDPAAIDAAAEPIEDRSSRHLFAGRGCGLTAVSTPTGCRAHPRVAVREVEVGITSSLVSKGIGTLLGTMSVPDGLEGPRPAVLLVGGSGPTDRDAMMDGDLVTRLSEPFGLFKALADHLALQGLVVLRYDKRSCAACYGRRVDWESFEFSDYVTDARDAVEWLSGRPEVNPRAIVIVGHSQGGQLAPLIASGDDRIAGVVMLAGTSQTLNAVSIEQLERAETLRRAQWDLFGAWSLRAMISRYSECSGRLEGPAYDPEERCVAPTISQRQVRRFDDLVAGIPDALTSLECPVMALQGTVDLNVHPGQVETYRQIMAGRDAEFHLVRGVDHCMTNALSPATPPRVDGEVLERVSAFLASIPKRP